MIELIEVLLWFLEVFIEIVFAFGLERPTNAYGRPLLRYPLWMYLGLAILGAGTGSLIAQLAPRRILPSPVIRGVSLFVSPLLAGIVMKCFGHWRTDKGHHPTVLATFWGGAVFAFGMAFVRWLMVGRSD